MKRPDPKGTYLLAVLVGLAVLAGCDGDEETPAGPETYEPTEPAFVLANVELSFNRSDARLLAAALSNDFAFHFDPADVGTTVNGYTIPTSWDRAAFLQAAGNLFSQTYELSLDNGWNSIGSPGAGEQTYYAYTVALSLTVMVTPNDGFLIDDGVCDYEFGAPEPGSWTLTAWYDRSRECGCLEPTTLGVLLARYYL
ncbi:MAG: hypothetical protein PVH29_07815 [Candidatus Zixiibacteriota bacterium]|jgi:hypothetical protein